MRAMAASAQPCIKPQAEWLCQRHRWMDVPSRGCPISCKESLQSQTLRLGCHSEPTGANLDLLRDSAPIHSPRLRKGAEAVIFVPR